MSLAAFAGAATLLLAALFGGTWLLSLRLRDASIVDPLWGPAFAAVAWLAYATAPAAPGARGLLVAVLATVWSLRLSLHLAWRARGKGEDPRYAAWRAEHGQRWWWRSLLQVFVLQGALVLIISAPLVAAQRAGQQALGPWDAAGLALFAVGFVFEAGSDLQLARFRARPENAGRLLTTGFWAWTRHPNYFGDACLWWGFGALAAAGGAWWTLFAPALMTWLLLRVSGVPLLEKGMAATRPGYAEYAGSTSAFLPRPPRRCRIRGSREPGAGG